MKKVKILCALIGSLLCQPHYHRTNTMAILFYVFIKLEQFYDFHKI